MIGTTKPTINAIRERSHWNSQNITPRDPVAVGLCKQIDLDEAVDKARRAGRKPAEEKPGPAPVQAAVPSETTRGTGGIPDWMAGVTVGGSSEGSSGDGT